MVTKPERGEIRADHAFTAPADQFDDLSAFLDAPDEAPTLARLAAKRRRYTRT